MIITKKCEIKSLGCVRIRNGVIQVEVRIHFHYLETDSSHIQ